MKLGFIGTGKIASSVITGICCSKISFTKILVSPRNKKIANTLKTKFKKVVIAKDNQEIVDNCSWVFLSITPSVGKKIIISNRYGISGVNFFVCSCVNHLMKVGIH